MLSLNSVLKRGCFLLMLALLPPFSEAAADLIKDLPVLDGKVSPTLQPRLPAPHAQIDGKKAELLLKQAASLLEQESIDGIMQAIPLLESAVDADPRNSRVRALLATAYMRRIEGTPRDVRTFEVLTKLLEPQSKRSEALEEWIAARAEFLRLVQRNRESLDLVDSARKDRLTAELTYQRAASLLALGDLDGADTLFLAAFVMKQNPRYLYGQYLARMRRSPDEAREIAEHLTKDFPLFEPGLLAAAELHESAGKHSEAIEILRKILKLDPPDRAKARRIAAAAFMGLGDRAAAFELTTSDAYGNDPELRTIRYQLKAEISDNKKAYNLILEARRLEKEGRDENQKKIRSLYVKAQEVDRNDPEPFLAFGEFLLKSGELQDAASRFLAAQEGRSIFPWASYVLGATLLKIWELEQAEIALKPLGDGDSRAEFLRGQIAKLSGNEVAVRDLHIARSLSAGAHFPDPFLTLGGLASEEKKHRLSEFFYAMALRYDQQNSEALLGLAQSRFSADSPSRAIAFLEERLKAQPKSAPIMTDLAMIYLKWGDDVSGKTHFQNAIRSDQKYAEAFRLLGNLTKEEGDKQRDFLAKRNDYRYALACYEMYSKLAPNDPEGYKSTADLYFDIRDLGSAAKNYHKVLDLTPKYPGIRLRLAQISRNAGNDDITMQLLREEIKVNPKSDAAWVEVGNIHMSKNDFIPAAIAYMHAAYNNEKNANALFGLGVIDALGGRHEDAIRRFSRALELDPLNPELYYQTGLSYEKLKKKKKALQALSRYKALVISPAEKMRAESKLDSIRGARKYSPDQRKTATKRDSTDDPEHPNLFEGLHINSGKGSR